MVFDSWMVKYCITRIGDLSFHWKGLFECIVETSKGLHFATHRARLWRQWPNMWVSSIHPRIGAQTMAETILNAESSDSPGDILTCCLFIWKSKSYVKQAKKQAKKLLHRSGFSVDPFPQKLVDGVGMCVWMEQVIWAIIVRSLPSSGVEPARCGGSALCPWSALPPGSSTDQATTPQCVESCSTRHN